MMKNFFKKNLIFLIYLTYFCHIETFSGCSSCKNDNNNKQTDETIEQKIERLKNEHINIYNNYSSTAKNTYNQLTGEDFTQMIDSCKKKWDESLKDEHLFNTMYSYLEFYRDEKKMIKKLIYDNLHVAYQKYIIEVHITHKNGIKNPLKYIVNYDINDLHEFVMTYTGDAKEITENTLLFTNTTDSLDFFIFNKHAYSKNLYGKDIIKPIDGSFDKLYYVVYDKKTSVYGKKIKQNYKANANFTKDNVNDVYILEILFTEENIE